MILIGTRWGCNWGYIFDCCFKHPANPIVTEPHLIEAVILKIIQMEQRAFIMAVLLIKVMAQQSLNINHRIDVWMIRDY